MREKDRKSEKENGRKIPTNNNFKQATSCSFFFFLHIHSLT